MEILKRDIDIYYQTWGEKEKPRLAIQIFHGMSEHISRYEDFAGFWEITEYLYMEWIFADTETPEQIRLL